MAITRPTTTNAFILRLSTSIDATHATYLRPHSKHALLRRPDLACRLSPILYRHLDQRRFAALVVGAPGQRCCAGAQPVIQPSKRRPALAHARDVFWFWLGAIGWLSADRNKKLGKHPWAARPNADPADRPLATGSVRDGLWRRLARCGGGCPVVTVYGLDHRVAGNRPDPQSRQR